jgi:hypothetical protein
MWARLAKVCQEAAERAIQMENEAATKGVAVCYAAQMGPELNFSSASQRKMVKSVQNVLGVQ